MRDRTVRFATALVFVVAASAIGAGTAEAAPTPLIVDSCGSTVSGAPGTPVSASLGSLIDRPDLGVIPIGAVGSRATSIDITNALTDVPVLGPLVGSVLGSVCTVTVAVTNVTNTVTAPVKTGISTVTSIASKGVHTADSVLGDQKKAGQSHHNNGAAKQSASSAGGTSPAGRQTLPPAGQQTPPAAGTPQTTGVANNSSPVSQSPTSTLGTAVSPGLRYGNLPFAMPGLFTPPPTVQYGGDLPGYAPLFGMLGPDRDTPVLNTGSVEALPAADTATTDAGFDLLLLLAVLILTGVTAALVRTKALRRAPDTGSS